MISAAVDFDLGHHADPREMDGENDTTWFHDEYFDESAYVKLDPDLTDKVFSRVKDISLDTTEKTIAFLDKQYPGESWADRSPQVLRGTSVTSDNYWKGIYDHNNALLICDTYGCTDPYAVTEIESVDIFETAMKNCFNVGKPLIDDILAGRLLFRN